MFAKCSLILLLGVLDIGFGDYPFKNISLPWNDRVNDLVKRLTLEEIVVQMAYTEPAPAIPRLGIDPYDWDTECLRGDVYAGIATSFPQSLGLAASFSPDLVYTIAEVTSVEVRAKNNNYTKAGIFKKHGGLSCFSPVINIMRHPLWGRNQETYGEDPFMNGFYAQHFVSGLQGDHPRYVRASAGCKHFDVHGGPDNIPVQRASFNSKVSIRDWRLTFLPAFRMCKEAGTFSFMCSYNAINGIPSCANPALLTDVLRNEWGFTGYVVSDGGAVIRVEEAHHYTNSSIETAAVCVKAGCNLELAGSVPSGKYVDIGKAVTAGLLPLKTVVDRVKPLFYTRMRLGEFDPSEMNPYKKIDMSVIESPEHVAISQKAAIKSIVMLKNTDGFLPLRMPIQSVAVVGPMADNPDQLFGDYGARSPGNDTITPYMALKALSENTRMAIGCSTTRCDDYNATSLNFINGVDLVVVCLGTGQLIESEANDRASMTLPGQQLQLLKDATHLANGAPVVLLLYNAGPVEIQWADENRGVNAILECFFPAQEAGNAVLGVLTGGESPAGRLPFTWYKYLNQDDFALPVWGAKPGRHPAKTTPRSSQPAGKVLLYQECCTPDITNYTMSERTYRYFTGEPLYPFGYGLSYSNFTYTDLSVKSPVIQAGQDQMVSVSLYNSGNCISDEVVQVYISWSNTSTPMPNLQLVGFDRLYQFAPRFSGTVNFPIQAHQMAQWDDSTNQFFIECGTITVYAGGQQPNQKRSVGSNVIHTTFQISGSKYIGRF